MSQDSRSVHCSLDRQAGAADQVRCLLSVAENVDGEEYVFGLPPVAWMKLLKFSAIRRRTRRTGK